MCTCVWVKDLFYFQCKLYMCAGSGYASEDEMERLRLDQVLEGMRLNVFQARVVPAEGSVYNSYPLTVDEN